MTDTTDQRVDERLNQLLIGLGKSLLQYVGEAQPWVPARDAGKLARLHKLVERQQGHVASLTDLLAARNRPIDWGIYPPEYTDLHYVSLDYLMGQLVQDQQLAVEDVAVTLAECRHDFEAADLLEQILVDERAILAQLEDLSRRTTGEAIRT